MFILGEELANNEQAFILTLIKGCKKNNVRFVRCLLELDNLFESFFQDKALPFIMGSTDALPVIGDLTDQFDASTPCSAQLSLRRRLKSCACVALKSRLSQWANLVAVRTS